MDDPAIGCTEITGHVATVLLKLTIDLDDFKVTDLVVGSDEMLAKIFSNTWV